MTSTPRFVLAALVCLPVVAAAQETPKVDPNSLQVTVRGCPKGRALVPLVTEGEMATPATLIGRPMRLNGPRALMKDIESEKGHLIEVTGLIRQSDLRPSGPSKTFGGTRVTVGAASPVSRDPTRLAMFDVIVLDVTSFRPLSNDCPASGRR